MKQNYTTIDTYRLSVGTYLKVSSIDNEEQPHYVVAKYIESGSEAIGDHCVSLDACWHFEGPTAGYDALSFFYSMIPEFSEDTTFIPVTDYPSYRK